LSIELPEAQILAGQMNAALCGKRVMSYRLQNHERLQRIGMINKDERSFGRIIGGVISSAVSRGNTILVALTNGANLILAPEYGGEVLFHKDAGSVPEKYHLRIDFDDSTALTVRLTSMGVINVSMRNDLASSYVYRRDFNPGALSPADAAFTLGAFADLLSAKNTSLKPVLVGMDAVIVGLSNCAFQDVSYRARLHPKRTASALDSPEKRNLYNSIAALINERIVQNGKEGFCDLYGRNGSYVPAMGPNMKGRACPRCGASIEMLRLGGGQVYICPSCQT
jgi:formamidopyrimidine-DNA glycosylase